MTDSLVHRVSELLAPGRLDAPASGTTDLLDAELLGTVELLAAARLLEQGRLDDATRLIDAAAERADTAPARQEAAKHLLLLARAWGTRGRDAAATARAERALQRAVE